MKEREYHGKKHTRLYDIYILIKQRTVNPKATSYENYGGRGVEMCEEWANSFTAFYERSMKNGYRNDLTIDRIDVNGNYEPSNCRWVDKKLQANNKRNNRVVEISGVKHTLQEWSEISGINRKTISDRLKAGYDPLRAITEQPYNKILYAGKFYTRKELAEMHGINYSTLKSRLEKGITIEEALTT